MSREAAFIERFAEVWRAIGQPSTETRLVLVAHYSEEWECVGESILGMPVYAVECFINSCPIAIADMVETETYVGYRFRQEWEARGQW